MAGELPVLVIGGTRGTGREIVSRLERDGHRVRALARNETAARSVLGPNVEIVSGDVTKPATLPAAVRGTSAVIFTAGVTMRPASERSIIAVEYDGVKNTLSAASASGFSGRFLYMTTLGITRPSLTSIGLNLIKGNTVMWRGRAEVEIRRSGIDYTIIRCGVLTNGDSNRPVEFSQRELRLSLLRRINRAAAAEVFVQALRHASASRATFDAVWSRRHAAESWDDLFARLRPDAERNVHKS
jgi:uncharacterized protein YbjT (DUF2867 family)